MVYFFNNTVGWVKNGPLYFYVYAAVFIYIYK